jgi:hypothetical protein
MTTRARYDSGTQVFYEDIAFEQVLPMSPVRFRDDFIGAQYGVALPAAGSPAWGCPWVSKIVAAAGAPTAALVANSVGGQIALTLAATSEKEEASLYFNDNLAFDVTKRLNGQFNATLSVPPSASGVQAVWGFSQAWADGPNNGTRYLEFCCTANNTLLCRSKDGVNTYSITAALLATPSTAITVDTNPHVFRIDASNPADVIFTMDGNRVNAFGSVTWGATAGANSVMQPYASVYKPSGTGLATLTLDKVQVWSNRV